MKDNSGSGSPMTVPEKTVAETAAARGLKILREIGGGSGGAVYLVANEQGQEFAMKVSRNCKLLKKEAEYMAMSANPMFPAFGNFWEANEAAFLLMEYIDGKAPIHLRGVKAGGEAAFAAELGACIARGLLPLQERNPRLIIRDIKPENMILTDDNSIRLVDLGLMCPEGINTALAGTDTFAAPEQFEIGSRLEVSADMYGLGKSMECICRSLLGADNPLPKKFSRIVAWFTEKNPRKRIPNARIAVKVLERYAKEGEQIRLTSLEKECMSGNAKFIKAIGIF